MRPAPAALLLLLAAAAPAAAKPVPPEDAAEGAVTDMARQSWRGEAVAACIDRLHAVPDLSPDNLETICGCAANAVLEANRSGPLPAVERGQIPAAVRGRVIMCTARTRPERAGDVARLTMDMPATLPPTAAMPGPTGAKPVDDADAGPPEENEGRGPGFLDWLRSLSLPAWLTGASLLWWIALGIFVFGLLILTLRRRDPRKDLTGPPPSMRRGAPPQPPRRPDLPR